MATAVDLRRTPTRDAYDMTRENSYRVLRKVERLLGFPKLKLSPRLQRLLLGVLSYDPGTFYAGDTWVATQLGCEVRYVVRLKAQATALGLVTIVKVRAGVDLPYSGLRLDRDVEVILPNLRRFGELLGETQAETTAAQSVKSNGAPPRAKSITSGPSPSASDAPPPSESRLTTAGSPPPSADVTDDAGALNFCPADDQKFADPSENSPASPYVKSLSEEKEIYKSSNSLLSLDLEERGSANPRGEKEDSKGACGEAGADTGPRNPEPVRPRLRLASSTPGSSTEDRSSSAEEERAAFGSQADRLIRQCVADGLPVGDAAKSKGRLCKLLRDEGCTAEELSLAITGATRGEEASFIRRRDKPFAWVFSEPDLRSKYAHHGRKVLEAEQFASAYARREREHQGTTPATPLPQRSKGVASLATTLASSVVGGQLRLVPQPEEPSDAGAPVEAPHTTRAPSTDADEGSFNAGRKADLLDVSLPPREPLGAATGDEAARYHEESAYEAPSPPHLRLVKKPRASTPRDESGYRMRIRPRAEEATSNWALEMLCPETRALVDGADA